MEAAQVAALAIRAAKGRVWRKPMQFALEQMGRGLGSYIESVRELGKTRRREARTVLAMIRIYCRAVHGGGEPCQACQGLAAYALRRLTCCPFGEEKPTCANCPIHCYRPQPREAMRQVMRFAGPRMFWRHPLLAIFHLIHGRKPAPPLRQKRPHAA